MNNEHDVNNPKQQGYEPETGDVFSRESRPVEPTSYSNEPVAQTPAPEPTLSFERVTSPYEAAQPRSTYLPPSEESLALSGSGHDAQEQSAATQTPTTPPVFDPQPVPVKQKRTIGLKSALALMLAAAVASGSITGVYLSRTGSHSAMQSSVVENLQRTPVANSTGNDAAAGSVEFVASTVLPAVVSIQVTNNLSAAEGSGSIISEDGYVLTNNHVIANASNGNARIVVTLNDGRDYEADLVAGDPNTDVAVIKLRDASGLPVMNFGDSSQVKVGQEVVAVGSPLGLSATVTSGIVSALNRPVRASGSQTGESSLIDAIQTDAAINPGNSGGPLVDMSGNLIGMNSVIASTSTNGGEAGSIGLGFAIPSNFARRVATQLIEKGEASQPMIGIQLAANARVIGAQIAEVSPDGPGAAAGLQAGEVVTAMDGRRIDSADALIAAVRSSDFGQTITLTLQSGDSTRDVEVTLTQE